MWNNWGGWNLWLELIIGGVGIIGGLQPFVIFNSAVVILRYIFPYLVPTQAKIFPKLIIGGVGITMSGVENFQQINYRGDVYSGVESTLSVQNLACTKFGEFGEF